MCVSATVSRVRVLRTKSGVRVSEKHGVRMILAQPIGIRGPQLAHPDSVRIVTPAPNTVVFCCCVLRGSRRECASVALAATHCGQKCSDRVRR